MSDLVAIGFNFDLIGSDYDASFSRPIKTKQDLINGARDPSFLSFLHTLSERRDMVSNRFVTSPDLMALENEDIAIKLLV